MAKKEQKEHKLKILVVDDFSNMRRTIRGMLSSIGYKNVIEADDGDTALVKIRTNPIDMVIADWNMPRLSGMELLTEVRDDPRLRDMPFIMITAESDTTQIMLAGEEDVDDFIIKPFVASTFESKIESVLERKANPPKAEMHLRMGMVCMDNGMFNDALEELENARALLPNSARVQVAFGKVYEKMGDLETAEKSLKSAIKLNPKYLKAYSSMADLQVKTGNINLAMDALTEASKLSPNNPKRLLIMGKQHLKQGNVDAAKRAFQNALTQAPHNFALMSDIGEAFLEAGNPDLAADTFKMSLKLEKDVNIFNRLGIALRRQKRFAEAIDNYRTALRLDPDDEVLHYNIGLALEENGEIDKAISEFKTALMLDPDFAECKVALETVQKTQGGRGDDDQDMPRGGRDTSFTIDYDMYGDNAPDKNR